MREKNFYAKVNQRITPCLDAGLRQEAERSNEDLADVVRDCLHKGLTERQKSARKKAKKEPPLSAV